MGRLLLLLCLALGATFLLRTPIDAAHLFADEFNGSLQPGWACLTGANAGCSVDANSLKLSVGRRNDQWVNRDFGAKLLRAPPQGSDQWVIETRVTAFSGTAGNTHAGLVVYRNAQNLLAWGWQTNSSLEAWMIIGNSATNAVGVVATKYPYLRIRKAKSAGVGYYSYYFDASADGVNWTNANVFRDVNGNLEGASIGFLGKDWNAGSGVSYTISFDYFRVHDGTEMPVVEDLEPSRTRRLAQETGSSQAFAGTPLVNNTASVNVCGTDLGVMFDWVVGGQARTYFAFGDTRSCRRNERAMRPNTLAFAASDTDAGDGIVFDDWIKDDKGEAKALFAPDSGGTTAIPTGAIALGDRAYIYYMNVTQWDRPAGAWSCNRASIASAHASDHGAWTKHATAAWSSGNFNQLAVLRVDAGGLITLYVYGIPCGRFGSVKLMKVEAASEPALQAAIINKSSYRYFAGYSGGGPVWSQSEAEAVTVAGGPAGELSVSYNAHLGGYVMTYLDQLKKGIVLRRAPSPQGPWSAPVLIARDAQYPQLYGPFMRPGYNEGEKLRFTLSQFGPYNVFMLETELP